MCTAGMQLVEVISNKIKSHIVDIFVFGDPGKGIEIELEDNAKSVIVLKPVKAFARYFVIDLSRFILCSSSG